MRKVKIVKDFLLERDDGQSIGCPVTGGENQCYNCCAWFSIVEDRCYCHGKLIGELVDAG